MQCRGVSILQERNGAGASWASGETVDWASVGLLACFLTHAVHGLPRSPIYPRLTHPSDSVLPRSKKVGR